MTSSSSGVAAARKPRPETQPPWSSCLACSPNVPCRSPGEFAKHLRARHCSKEGGSFVCLYGVNGVCPSLPLEGVSDRDYENHVRKHHMEDRTACRRGSESSPAATVAPTSISHVPSIDSSPDVKPKWTVYDATTNVASVLSDPHKPRPADFFSKTWGDAFTRTTLSPSPLVPRIDRSHVQDYLDRTSARCQRRRSQKAAEAAETGEDIADGFPGSIVSRKAVQKSLEQERQRLALEEVPKLFFRSDFGLDDPPTFNAVFAHWSKMEAPGFEGNRQSSKLLQEKLSHYLDVIEQAITDQIASRSDAFFHALASHDELQDHMARTCNSIENLRSMMRKLEAVHVRQPLTVLGLAKRKENHLKVYHRLKTMSTVHATQQTIQLLLATSEYVGALDLISTTQEVLNNELTGVHCFRYLGTQLSEIEGVIEKMLVEDFTAYAQADLNRPVSVNVSPLRVDDGNPDVEKDLDYPGVGLVSVEGKIMTQRGANAESVDVQFETYGADSFLSESKSEPLVFEEERLVALVLGMLRIDKFNFVDIYRSEIAAATKTLIRQAVSDRVKQETIDIDQLPSQDPAVACLADEMRLMTFAQWLPMMDIVFRRIIVFLRRVKAAHNVMSDVLCVAAGRTGRDSEPTLRSPEPPFLKPKRRSGSREGTPEEGGVIGIGGLADRRFVRSDSSLSAKLCGDEDEFVKQQNRLRDLVWFACDHAQDRCIKVIASRAKGGYMDKISSVEFVLLCKMVESFAAACERVCGRRGTALRSSLTTQAGRFVNRFHEERKTKLSLILDSERWKVADVPSEFQVMADEAFRTGELLPPPTTKSSAEAANNAPPPQQHLLVNGEPFAVVGTVLLLMRMMADYCKCVRDIPSTVPEVLSKLVELLKTFNSRTCQLVVGAGALQLVGLKTISTKNLALASRSLQLALTLVKLIKRKYVSSLSPPPEDATRATETGPSSFGESTENDESRPPTPTNVSALTKTRRHTLTRHFNQLEKDYNEHIQLIHNKLVNIVESMFERDLENWEAKAPVPSACFRSIGRQLVKFHEAIVDLLPRDQVRSILLDVHDALLVSLGTKLRRQGIANDGGPKHGLVMTELAFYVENLKSLSGLDASEFETWKVWTRE